MTTPQTPRAERRDRNALRGIPRNPFGSLRLSELDRALRTAPPAPPGRRKFHQRAMLLARAGLRWGWEWARNLVKPTRPLPPLPSGDTGVYALPDGPLTIGLAADWGSGTADAYAVGDALGRLEPDVTIHLGDVYYSGRTDEFQNFFLPANCWPRGTRGTYLLNGNHEMYSGGEGYFERALPTYRQPTSYFCLSNKWWRVVALDTGYHCSKDADLLLIKLGLKRDSTRLPAACVSWLEQVVFADPGDRRPVILLTHHQPFSAFERDIYPQIVPPLAPYLDRIALWFWGHEHRFALYAKHQDIRGRCIGHGGIPVELPFPALEPGVPVVLYDDRAGPTPVGEQKIGLNGFALLRFDAAGGLVVRYYDQLSQGEPDFLVEEEWRQQRSEVVGVRTRLGPRGGGPLGLRLVRDLQELTR